MKSVKIWLTIFLMLGASVAVLPNLQGMAVAETVIKKDNEDKKANRIFVDMLQLAEQGDAVAQHNLAVMYIDRVNGGDREENYAQALKWFTKAAEQGYVPSQYELYALYDWRSFKVDEEKALKWLKQAAEQGHIQAQNSLGASYYWGRLVEKNDEQAAKWYRAAASQGDRDSQYHLSWMYQKGEGVEKNNDEALRLMRKAADQEDAMAQYDLGLMYEEGKLVGQDYDEAMKWYERAAGQGNEAAEERLGHFPKSENRFSDKKCGKNKN